MSKIKGGKAAPKKRGHFGLPCITSTTNTFSSSNIKPQNPVGLGLCSGVELEKVVDVARARAGIVHGETTGGQASQK